MIRPHRLIPAALLAGSAAAAQDPSRDYSDAFEVRRARADPVVRYTVRVDPSRPTSYAVEMEVRDAPDTLRLAMPVWAPGAYRVVNFAQYVRDVAAAVDGAPRPVAADGPSAWRVVVGPPNGRAPVGGAPNGVPAGDGRPAPRVVTVRWRVAFPTPAAAATLDNRGFLTADGALFDGPATFLYIPGRTLLPAHVRLDLPADWRVVTGLVPTADPRTFYAPSYDVLIDSPVLAGAPRALHVWPFDVDGVPHRVAFWARPRPAGGLPFDSAHFVAIADTVVRTARAIMGSLPYREYAFLYVDSTGGGLEHLSSTTIGTSAARLARDPHAAAEVTAHEYFHLWNVKRLRPVELGPFAYDRVVRTPNLWWSEGVTDFFAAEILRRSGLADSAAAVGDLADKLGSWLGNPAATRLSPERSSWTAWDPPSVNGGYSLSYYTQGALLGELLELRLRDATGLRRGMDDVMRRLYERFSGPHGFTAADVRRAATETCGCDLSALFEGYVHGAGPTVSARAGGAAPIDWNRWLALAGWRIDSTRATALDSATGRPRPDLRATIIAFAGIGSAGGPAGNRPRISVSSPPNVWARAGLVTGDELVTVNGHAVADSTDFRLALAGARVGDTVRVAYVRDGAARNAAVVLRPYEQLRVRLVDLPTVDDRQRRLRACWLRGSC